jgi:hypothetical protein
MQVADQGGKTNWIDVEPQSNRQMDYFGFVLVRPKDINEDFLLALASRLKAEYCHATTLQVVIFYSKKYANPLSIEDLAQSKGETILMRGFYTFDRESGRDKLEFSKRLGNRTTEIQIDITTKKECASRCD